MWEARDGRAQTEKWTFCSSREKWFFLIGNKEERSNEGPYKFVTLGTGCWGGKKGRLVISILFLCFSKMYMSSSDKNKVGEERIWNWRIQKAGNSCVEIWRESQLENKSLKRWGGDYLKCAGDIFRILCKLFLPLKW